MIWVCALSSIEYFSLLLINWQLYFVPYGVFVATLIEVLIVGLKTS